MSLWTQINEKWDTIPAEESFEKFKPRLMLHLAHAFAALGIVMVGSEFVGELWQWCIGVNVLMFIREVIQNIAEGETWWSCVFDTVQTLFVWFPCTLVYRMWWQSAVVLVVFLFIYFFFLLRDEKWFRNQGSTPNERVIIS